jgi:hypothetical protein
MHGIYDPVARRVRRCGFIEPWYQGAMAPSTALSKPERVAELQVKDLGA